VFDMPAEEADGAGRLGEGSGDGGRDGDWGEDGIRWKLLNMTISPCKAPYEEHRACGDGSFGIHHDLGVYFPF
jgi:hypothetical protein